MKLLKRFEAPNRVLPTPYITRHTVGKQFKKQWRLLLLLTPGILCYLVFSYLPMFGIVVAFQDYNIFKGFTKSPFVGLKWFQEMIRNVNFIKVILYTIKMSLTKLVLGFPAPIILALLINEICIKRFKKLVQTLSYLPHFLSWVIVSIIIYRVLDANDGIVNNIISLLGLDPIEFMGNAENFIPIVAFSEIWKEVGFGSIFYLAALTSIDPTLYEVAEIDGARKFKQLLHVTLPNIAPTIIMLFILSIAGLVSANFDQVYNLQNPLIQIDTEVINTYIYRKAILDGFYSFSTAFGLAQGVISFILIYFTNQLSKKISDVSIY